MYGGPSKGFWTSRSSTLIVAQRSYRAWRSSESSRKAPATTPCASLRKGQSEQKGPAELPAFSVKDGSFLGRLVETSHAARHLRLDRRCHISSHFSRQRAHFSGLGCQLADLIAPIGCL